MSVNIISIAGSDSIAGSRLTINNNFQELKTSVDPLLDNFDTSNGVINISESSTGQIIAKRLTVTTAGITVQGGAVTIGSSSTTTLNGGNFVMTTGSASFGGGLESNGIDITSSSTITESGDSEFLGSAINDTTVRRTIFIGSNNANGSIDLQALTSTTEVFIVNDKSTAVSLTIANGSGLLGNNELATSINLVAGGAALLKFIVPSDSITGKWWYFGDVNNIQV